MSRSSAQELGVSVAFVVRFDQNESPYGSPDGPKCVAFFDVASWRPLTFAVPSSAPDVLRGSVSESQLSSTFHESTVPSMRLEPFNVIAESEITTPNVAAS